jgi:methionyl aminopeptidase
LGTGVRLKAGTVLCIEPMIAMGDWKVRVLNDGWTAVTVDRKPAAHYENTVVITDGEPELLTLAE